MGVQQERLGNVLKYLKERGTNQSAVAEAIGIDKETLSSLKSGKMKNIPSKTIEKLEEIYGVNPYYILGESEMMFTLHLKKLKYFDQLVDAWDTVEGSEQKYLHLYMDRNFYNFLVEVNKIRLAEEDGILTASDEIRNLAHVYEAEAEAQEFVLLPRNNFLEILKSVKEDKEKLGEVINFLEHIEYLESEETD